MSHPAWVCGLKLLVDYDFPYLRSVTPCVGVWIETILPLTRRRTSEVTPCVGVWIETVLAELEAAEVIVTPCVGVWIETKNI